ncbi:MAG: neutral zinc metallopeptidase [Hyphomicrobiaceae bacterium]
MVKWKDGRESENVEDRRGESGGMGGGFPFPGGGGRTIQIPMGRRGGGIGIFGLLIIAGIMLLLGINPLDVLTGGGGNQFPLPRVDRDGGPLPKFEIPDLPGSAREATQRTPTPSGSLPAGDDEARFVKVIFGYTEDVWTDIFKQIGRSYRTPTLVMFSGQTPTACGPGMSMMGPFYCPLDEKVYIDLDFYRELQQRFGAPGDFAQAYVVAHEVGHHVQKLFGIADRVQEIKQQVSERDANALQVRMELQADCFAGVWANQANQEKGILESGDVEEGLNAAKAIGDDRIQRQTQGRVVPDAFTHGSSEQRVRWLRRGLESGDIRQCDTFRTDDL